MSIEALVGRPGSGKSYEAVANHILRALREGRYVVTNLPLNIGAIRKLGEFYTYETNEGKQTVNIADLVVLVKPNKRNNNIPFSVVEDFTDYQHLINDKGKGVYYVIDECHKAFGNANSLSRDNATIARVTAISEWFAEHRHVGADVMIITQHIQKVFKPIADNVQSLYMVSKLSNYGLSNKYRLKLYDGIGADAAMVGEPRYRVYNPAIYPLYDSHTTSSFLGRKVVELNDFDRPRWWQNSGIWKLLALFSSSFVVIYFILGMMSSETPEAKARAKKERDFLAARQAREATEAKFKAKLEEDKRQQERLDKEKREAHERQLMIEQEQKKREEALRTEKLNNHPYYGYKIVYVGEAKYIRFNGAPVIRTYFAVYDRNKLIANENSDNLKNMGYTLLQDTWGHVKLAYLGVELPMHVIMGVPNRVDPALSLTSSVMRNHPQPVAQNKQDVIESDKSIVKPVPQ